jgi:transcription initiation factor IIF auxiliary subunit
MRKSEGGSGGRKGHSNMSHHDRTAEVKDQARTTRRQNDDLTIAEQLEDDERMTLRRDTGAGLTFHDPSFDS